MSIYNLYIFDHLGTCLYYAEWNRKNHSSIASEEEYKLMYGMLFSMKSFCNRLSPTDLKDGFLGFRTSKYKLHYYETPTGLKIVMTTEPNMASMRDTLQQIYSQLYLEYVVRNPLYRSGEKITSELFKVKLDEFIKSLPAFGKY